MDGGILLNGAVTNATGTTLTYQDLSVIIAAVGLFIALFALLYNVAKELGELKGTKAVVESRLEFIDQKYNTIEKIQQVELDNKNKIYKNYADNQFDKLEEKILKLNTELQTLKAQGGNDGKFIANKFNQIESNIRNLDEKLEKHQEGHAPKRSSNVD